MQTQNPDFLEQVNAVIESNLDNEFFSSTDLAKKVFLCRMQLYRKIKEQTNLPPSHYIRNYRLIRACDLLRKTDLPIGRISTEVGFSWPAYFTRCFKVWSGLSPGAFRKTFS